jgi:hypothetical protein
VSPGASPTGQPFPVPGERAGPRRQLQRFRAAGAENRQQTIPTRCSSTCRSDLSEQNPRCVSALARQAYGFFGARNPSTPSGTRTHTEASLSRLPLPIGLWGPGRRWAGRATARAAAYRSRYGDLTIWMIAARASAPPTTMTSPMKPMSRASMNSTLHRRRCRRAAVTAAHAAPDLVCEDPQGIPSRSPSLCLKLAVDTLSGEVSPTRPVPETPPTRPPAGFFRGRVLPATGPPQQVANPG